MKVLMLGWELPPHNSGGLGVACLNMSRALARDGAEIDFVVPYTAPHEHTSFMNVLEATSYDPLLRYGMGAYDLVAVCENERLQTISIREVQHDYCDFVEKYLMEYKPDVVHAHDWLTFEAGMLAKKNYGIPLIAHVHATEFDRSGMNGGNPLVIDIERNGLLLADRIIAVSEATKDLIIQKYQIPAEKISVVHNSLDEDFINSTYSYDADDYYYLQKMKDLGYTIVSTVGRFTVQKGLKNLVRAAALAISKNPKLLFVFAGDGEQKHEIIRLSARYGIAKNIIFPGFVRGKQLRDIYEISDIFVMSSVSEPFGLTALEAAHHDDAMIITKQSGVHEVIRSVMTYDFWDVEKLANEILVLASEPSLSKTLRAGMRRECQNISWADVAKKIEKIYTKYSKRKEYK